MPPAIADPKNIETEARPFERVIDAARQVAHLRHEVQAVTSQAADAVEDGVHATKRAIKRRVRALGDLRDGAAYRIKRQPFTALALAAGAGVVFGIAVGWIGGRCLVAKSAPGAR